MSDKQGIICKGQELSPAFDELADFTNKNRITGTLADAMKGADVFVGVSAGGIVSKEMVSSMAENAVVMAMANPVPEIMPDEALAAAVDAFGEAIRNYLLG
jgi:malate dehydrogenase (oxaloacetate-decarboxylating)